MKKCPQCRREYDLTMMFCLDDGAELLYGPANKSEPGASGVPAGASPSGVQVATGSSGGQFGDEPQTAILSDRAESTGEAPTRAQIHTAEQTAVLPGGAEAEPQEGLRGSTEKRSFSARRTAEPQGSLGGLPEKQSFSARRAKPLAVLVVAAVVLVGGYFGYRYFTAADSGTINSIAVLPFENRGGNADSEYLSDGLAESLIYRLSQLPDLKVSPTSSVFRYKGKETDPQVIAKELGVDSVMTGRITERGDNLTISVNLVDTRNGKSLWGEQYERKLSELLTTQREIVAEIVSKLQLKLSGESEQKLAKKYTNNDEAYQLYLRGQYHLARRSKDDLLKAIDYYEQAIKLDPNFALAYVGMSYTYSSGIGNAFLPYSYEEGLSRAKNAAVRAVEIDANLAEAHTAMGTAFRLERKWPEAERALKKALEIDPNNARAHYFYGLYLQNVGRTGDAVRAIKMAVDLEPMSLIMQANLGGAYLFDRQSELGLDQAKRTFDLDPNFISGRFWLAYAYTVNQRFAEAIELIETGPQDEVNQRLLARFRGFAYAKTGRRSEAEAVLAKYSSDPAYDGANSAVIYGALGEKDKAFAALEKGFARKEDMARIKVDPLFDDLRDDPRFKDLQKRMGLPE